MCLPRKSHMTPGQLVPVNVFEYENDASSVSGFTDSPVLHCWQERHCHPTCLPLLMKPTASGIHRWHSTVLLQSHTLPRIPEFYWMPSACCVPRMPCLAQHAAGQNHSRTQLCASKSNHPSSHNSGCRIQQGQSSWGFANGKPSALGSSQFPVPTETESSLQHPLVKWTPLEHGGINTHVRSLGKNIPILQLGNLRLRGAQRLMLRNTAGKQMLV